MVSQDAKALLTVIHEKSPGKAYFSLFQSSDGFRKGKGPEKLFHDRQNWPREL